jgi:hypothetical protein
MTPTAKTRANENDDSEEMTCQFIVEEGGGRREAKEATTTTDQDGEGCMDHQTEDTTGTQALHENHDLNESTELQVGDHVYQWRSLAGIPWVFQHHGIVMDVLKDDECGVFKRLIIADFSNVETKSKGKGGSSSSNNSRLTLVQEGVLRTYTDADHHTWHKVHYEAPWWKRQVYRSGTATKARSDPVGMVLARVNFILQHPHLLPDYHVFHANCECVAFWCKTGIWGTLQASSFFELTAAGHVKSSATLAATAAGATSTVTAPAAGVWGWLGYTSVTQVSWLSLHPMAIPGLACYAAITVGVPAMMYVTAKKQWKATTERLKEQFWEAANENPQIFAECLTHWSEKG